MDRSLTVVLPIHNAERTLRRDVRAVLDAAADLSPKIEVLVVDNASTDDSYEAASELAVEFPQVRVLRRPQRAGLGEALGRIRRGLDADTVIVHDGASPIEAAQLREVWSQQLELVGRDEGVSFADLRRPAATQKAMEAAHRRLATARPATLVAVEDDADDAGVIERRDAASRPEPARATGVGKIPQLPAMRPGVLGALSDFARGE